MNIKMYQLSFQSVLLRFYLMMAVVTIGLFTGQIWMYYLGFIIVFSCMMGISFQLKNKKKIKVKKHTQSKVLPMEKLKQVG